MKKIIIIGSGPSGITTGIYLKRAKIDNVIISNNQGTLKKAELIENYYGFDEPIPGVELMEKGIKQYKKLGGEIIIDEVIGLDFEDKLVVKGLKEKYKADIVVIATGVSRLLPNIKGLNDQLGISYCAICDSFFYRGKDVIVLGNGNYSVSEAEVLKRVTNSVTIYTNGREMSCDTEIDVVTNKIDLITKENGTYLIHLSDGSVSFTDGIFVAEGIAGAMALAKKIGAKIDNNKIVVDENKKTTIPNLYAIGDCTGGILQISKAIYDGTVAAMNIIKENKKEE